MRNQTGLVSAFVYQTRKTVRDKMSALLPVDPSLVAAMRNAKEMHKGGLNSSKCETEDYTVSYNTIGFFITFRRTLPFPFPRSTLVAETDSLQTRFVMCDDSHTAWLV